MADDNLINNSNHMYPQSNVAGSVAPQPVSETPTQPVAKPANTAPATPQPLTQPVAQHFAPPPPSFVSTSTPDANTIPTESVTNVPASAQTPFSPPPPPPPIFTQASENVSVPGSTMVGSLRRKKSPFGMVAGVLLLLVLAGGAAAFYFLKGGGTLPSGITSKTQGSIPKQQVDLTYWGLWEPNSVIQGIIDEYQAQNPHVKITYVEQSKTDYRTRLQSSIQNQTGPDIFRYHNTWFPMLKSVMQPDTNDRVSMDDYYPVIKENAVIGGETFGVPVGFDTLSLYYNPEKFQAAGLSAPPTTWSQLIEYAEKLTVTDIRSGIQISGIAMGTTNNVDHWSDIVGLLLMQSEADPAVEVPASVLQFYTQFSTTKKFWDSTLPNSTYAFATEKAAMMFAPSWRAHEIKAINPELEFKTAPVPQLTETPVGWASYWLEGVSRESRSADEAWKFLAFLSRNESLTKLYTSAAQVASERTFGEPYPKMSLASSIQTDPVAGSFVAQGNYAKSWYLCARTFDDGLNDGISKYFEDAINAINKGASADSVLPALSSGINQKLSSFGLSNSQPSINSQDVPSPQPQEETE